MNQRYVYKKIVTVGRPVVRWINQEELNSRNNTNCTPSTHQTCHTKAAKHRSEVEQMSGLQAHPPTPK